MTTHIPGRPYDDLLRQKGFGGFPTLCVMDADGEVLYQLPGSDRSIEGFYAAVDRTERLLRARKAVETGEPGARNKLLLLLLDMGQVGFDDALAQAKELTLDPDEQIVFQVRLVETLRRFRGADLDAAIERVDWLPAPRARAAEIRSDTRLMEDLAPLMAPIRAVRPGETPEPRPYGIAYELWQQGRKPSPSSPVEMLYWDAVRRASVERKDLAGFEDAAAVLRKRFADNAAYLEGLDKDLATLRGGQ
ncbi:MAG: hypothetical protein IPM29_27570 [Planctomycetes bacterium]|nr:hypothetical protein [Planctomycetota bacterium]